MGSPITNPLQQAQWRLFNPSQNPFGSPDASQAPTPAAATPPGSGTPSPSPMPSPASDGPSTLFGTSAAQSSSTPSPTSPPPADSGQVHPASSALFGQQAPAQSLDDFIQQHGHAPIAAPPPDVPQHGMLYKIFNGIGRYLGNPMAEQAEQRDWQLKQQGIQYQRDQPVMQRQADEQAYNEALGQGKSVADIGKVQYDVGKEQQTAKANAISQIQQEVESGKYGAGDALVNRWRRIAQANPHIGLTDEDIQGAVSSTKPLGSKYTLVRDPQTQAPIELVDRQGNHYSKSNLPNDPDAQQMWNDAETGAQNKEQVEEGKEKRVAGYAADRQAQAFSNQQTEQGRKAASQSLQDINDAKNQQKMMETLLSGKMNPTSQTAAMFKMIGLEQPTGTHRIMPAEIEGIEQQGGLSDRLKQKLLNWKQGDRFSPDLIPDVISTAKTLSNNKIKTANDNLESTARIYGYKAPGSDAKGRFDKPEDYQDQTGNQGGNQGGAQNKTPPQGATHIGIGSVDKKKHYLDAQGNDLGLAE